jgi:hypothetical protein
MVWLNNLGGVNLGRNFELSSVVKENWRGEKIYDLEWLT